MEKKIEKRFSEAEEFLNIDNLNLKKAETIFRSLAEEGYFKAQVYMLLFAIINDENEEKTNWFNEVSKVDSKFANDIVVHHSKEKDDLYKKCSDYLKANYDFSYYYKLDWIKFAK